MTDHPTDPAALLAKLIACRSVTPDEGGALDLLQAVLEPLGFAVHRLPFRSGDGPVIDNLFATLGTGGAHLLFAGHTDVVPAGDDAAWTSPPFEGRIADGHMTGRGAVDMKGGIAAFVAAIARLAEQGELPDGRISLLITGDEEGPAIDGTLRVLNWLSERGETFDACLVGEPTNPDALGDMIKIGRRGSHTGRLTVRGTQGHVAYPHLADNPVHSLVAMAAALTGEPLDDGTERFQPSSLQITTIDVGNAATNVIPAAAHATFNIRFNDRWTAQSLVAEVERRIAVAAAAGRGDAAPAEWSVEWAVCVSDVFVTEDAALAGTLSDAVEAETGRRPALSTSGGTSDARFIKDHCPVIEFGLVGQTMHKVDERVSLDDLERLTAIYRRFIADWLRRAGRQP